MYDEKIDDLLDRFEKHRKSIDKMIAEMEDLKQHVNNLLPAKMDHRHYRFFEEKVKAITSFFNTLLDMRKEIAKSIKDEVELRRKIKTGDDDFDPEKDLDLRSIAHAVEKLNNDKERIKNKIPTREKYLEEEKSVQEKVIEKLEEEMEDDEPMIEEIEIPGINTALPHG